MLTLFKPKIILKNLIPDNYTDIHSHLLPSIDDGALTFEDTLQLITSLQKFGTCQFITTPHIMQYVWDNTHEEIKLKEKETVLQLLKKDFNAPLKAAAEYLMDDHFVNLFKAGQLLTLTENYVLVEMSYLNPPIQLYSILFDLQVAGYVPVLAHPERYLFYHSNLNEYDKLKKAGCLFQLNLLSVVGYYGLRIRKIAEQLLKKGMYDYVGSDVHHHKHIAAFNLPVYLKDLAPLKEAISNNDFFRFA